MRKLQSLADALVAAFPVLATDPDRLAVFADRGRLVASMAPGLAWEYRYTASLALLDFTDDQDALFLPIVAWVRDNQPDLFQNRDRREDAIGFEAEMLANGRCDIRIELALTESVRAVAAAGGYTVEHAPEPRFDSELLPHLSLPIDTTFQAADARSGAHVASILDPHQ